ncbi:DNA polymerase IV [Cumulibacter manganitolerans]|uniref:DNA polymerase IV n=1 Tax=Cumulibacter manganitolerans TaxID=1884992 RepID=UPI001294ED7D|nr:DNA polymerase IV [Cumulibacter manganitolerans]
MPAESRDFPRILHVDLDQFQVSVERQRDPSLIGRVVVVGGNGDPQEPRKVVTCASYEARALGVHAGMPLRTAARKVPDAVWLPTDHATYDEWSAQVMSALRATAPAVEVWGWDEAFAGCDGDPVALAAAVRAAIADATGLPSAVGISDNKQRAKMATGFAKKSEQRYFVLDDGNWLELMGERPCIDLWSVGPRIAQRLAGLGVRTVNELIATDRDDLVAAFGPHQGGWLYVLCRGWGDRSIVTRPEAAKSHSKVETFARDLAEPHEIERELVRLTAELREQILAERRVVFRVAVTIRTSTFYTRTKSHKLAEPTTDLDVLEREVLALLPKFEIDRPVRLLGPRFDLVPVD